MVVTDLEFDCGSEPVVGAVCTAVAQLVMVVFLTQALFARTDLPTYAMLATHDGHSQKTMMSEHEARGCSTSCHIATCLFLNQDRTYMKFIVNELYQRMSNRKQQSQG